jgi:hypothetical protein
LITSDERKIWEILVAVSLALPRISFRATPPEIGREVYKIISEITGVSDPYGEIKERCTRQALALYPEMKRLLDSSSQRLMTALRIAIAGNVIDFGAQAAFDLKEDIKKILSQDFAIDHFQQFRRALRNSSRVLYVADNAGETVFDRILIEELEKPVTYVVREKPVINDAVKKDALDARIDQVAGIVSSGTDAPGTILPLCSEKFLEILGSADLIISKGQGNYEGLSEENLPIFFLLKAKCRVIAKDIGVEEGDIILMKAKRFQERPL